MSNLVSEVRYAFRSLNKSRTYAAAFVLTLGLGIGVNTAIFSVVNGVLLKPLPYQDADRILFVQQPANRAGAFNAAFSFIEIDDYRASSRTVDEFIEFGDWDFSVIGRGDPHRVVGGLVTANYFEVLGILPLYGRTLLPGDNDVGAPPVMVLTHDYWTRMFGADPSIVGQTVKLTTKSVEVVGVLEPGSHYTGRRKPDVFTNYATNDHYTGAAMRDARNHRMTDVFARLAPGAISLGTRCNRLSGRVVRSSTLSTLTVSKGAVSGSGSTARSTSWHSQPRLRSRPAIVDDSSVVMTSSYSGAAWAVT